MDARGRLPASRCERARRVGALLDRCDVIVIGGGPGGSSVAWGLRDSGLDVVIVDRKVFPRDKICAGWITPQILDELSIDAQDYRKERVLQPIRGFAVSHRGGREAIADRGDVVSYGIRRCEFDHYLLERSGARLRLGCRIADLRRAACGWVVNGELEAPILVGAGGHFCPAARALGAEPGRGEPAVYAREIEFELTPQQAARCPAAPEMPALFFERDLRGYGWVVRKGDWLNVGLGRQDPESLGGHVDGFLDWLVSQGRVPADLPRRLKGHAYLLYDQAPRPLVGEDALLVGDAAGLAYGRSGEGIRPAVESGLLAARTLRESNGRPSDGALAGYEAAMRGRFGARFSGGERPKGPSDLLPKAMRAPIAGWLLGNSWFAGHVVIDRWFLHRREPPLPAAT